MEATFEKEYGIDARDALRGCMTWRRFRVLFNNAFTIADTEESGDAEFDWNAALDKASGRDAPSNTQKMTMDQFRESMM